VEADGAIKMKKPIGIHVDANSPIKKYRFDLKFLAAIRPTLAEFRFSSTGNEIVPARD
jgi:hypothetical protein